VVAPAGCRRRPLGAEQFTESTLLDYVRAQLDESPKPAPETVNARSSLLRRLFRFYFHDEMPHPGAGRAWWRRSPLGYGRRRVAFAADLKLKVPRRVIVPLQPEQVARFWQSFAAARDLAMVALMLLNGLRSREVIGLRLSDVLWSEAQLRVRGKGARVRVLPLPPETMRILQCWLKTERPATPAPELFVCLKGKARGCPMTPAGLRSLFRHHRATTGVTEANPHRFRHTFGSDMSKTRTTLRDPRRRQFARTPKADGPRAHSHYFALHPAHGAGRLCRVCARGGEDGPRADAMKRPPHALAQALEARLRLLATTLRPSTAAQYLYTVRLFLAFLDEAFPDARRPSDLKRDPHTARAQAHPGLARASVDAARPRFRQAAVQRRPRRPSDPFA
jgi:integrase/recombinase XerC